MRCTVKERPILFNGEMVRAILAGRKTQTRRPVEPQPPDVRRSPFVPSGLEDMHGYELRCPFGQPGDRLWVRETWGFSAQLPASTRSEMHWLTYRDLRSYRADNPAGNWCWRASIHMPRWASRIKLEITAVWVERLQDISEADAQAEGATAWHDTHPHHATVYRPEFRALWDALYAKRGLGWDVNPWVWAISFRRLEATQ